MFHTSLKNTNKESTRGIQTYVRSKQMKIREEVVSPETTSKQHLQNVRTNHSISTQIREKIVISWNNITVFPRGGCETVDHERMLFSRVKPTFVLSIGKTWSFSVDLQRLTRLPLNLFNWRTYGTANNKAKVEKKHNRYSSRWVWVMNEFCFQDSNRILFSVK